MNTFTSFLFAIGGLSGLILSVALVWSILIPSKRVWPPAEQQTVIPFLAWGLTLAIFGSVIGLGIIDWGSIISPDWLRWGVGPILIVLGNFIVWWGAFSIGMKATSGGKKELITTGLYRFSRHPQYVADIGILVGFGLLFSSIWVWPIVWVGVLVLAVATFAEEPWLRVQYGSKYDEYRAGTRRFF
jgi:protein-S-isoprenylcysteine O-methyltransferase Ste14